MATTSIVTSPSVSEIAASHRPAFVVIGNAQSARVALFQEALAGLGLPPARIVGYGDLLDRRVALSDRVPAGSVVRIESPDRDFAVEQALLALGADEPDDEGTFARLDRQAVARLTDERGAIRFPRQWFLGYRAALRLIARQLAACPAHQVMNAPDEIATMFDKPRCHALLAERGLPVPAALGPVRSYDELLLRMREARCSRVFIKLAHGSSASGVVAYQISGPRHRAMTTVELARDADGLRLFNNLRVRVYRDQREIAALIDALCQHRAHVERWLPKAGFQDRTFDLRVVVIGGAARHAVVRMSRHAMTNLHLSAGRTSGRAPVESLLTRFDPAVWEAARASCERAMALFPQSLYAGIDLLLLADRRRHAIAEVNAFGDLLYNVWHEGKNTYTTEIEAACRQFAARMA